MVAKETAPQCSKQACCSVAAKGLAALRQEKSSQLSGGKRACHTVAAKKPDTLWQQKSMLLTCRKIAWRSVAAKRHAALWQRRIHLLCGSKKPPAYARKSPVA